MSASLLDKMEDGNEFLSAIQYPADLEAIQTDILTALKEIAQIRKRRIICYAGNSLNPNIKGNVISQPDELPFYNLLEQAAENRSIDIALMTPGGSIETVKAIVKNIRRKFDDVSFIVLHMAMSAGTVLCLSGNEIIMDDQAYLGPIDPQVLSKNGMLVPAQSLKTLLQLHKNRKEGQYEWCDDELIKNIDSKEVGVMHKSSLVSFQLAKEYLLKSLPTDKNQKRPVSENGIETARKLCNNSSWFSHGEHITRDIAEEKCLLNITHSEDIKGLDRAIKRFTALLNLLFIKHNVSKVYATEKNVILLHETTVPINMPANQTNNSYGTLQQWPHTTTAPQQWPYNPSSTQRSESWKIEAR